MRSRLIIMLVMLNFSFCNRQNQVVQTYPGHTCIYGICFRYKPELVDSLMEKRNYNGLNYKVFNVKLIKEEIKSFDSLLLQPYNRLPIKEWTYNSVISKKYLENSDTGYYKYEDDQFTQRVIILNLSKQKLIFYEDGDLHDLYIQDSINHTLDFQK